MMFIMVPLSMMMMMMMICRVHSPERRPFLLLSPMEAVAAAATATVPAWVRFLVTRTRPNEQQLASSSLVSFSAPVR